MAVTFPYGELIDSLPEGFEPKEQWAEYPLDSLPFTFCNPRIIGSDPRGLRWNLGPLYIEEYISDKEPDLALSDRATPAPLRLIFWRRLTTSAHPEGWHRSVSLAPSSGIEGFATLAPGEEYWKKWSESARRYRRHWLQEFADARYRIEEGTFEQFALGYRHSTVAKKTLRESLQITRDYEKGAPERMRYWIARRLSDGTIVAGLSVITSPSAKSAYYATGFYHKDIGDDPVMIGLMDHWHRVGAEEGYTYLHFGNFWFPGQSKSFRGFSAFKAKFGLRYIAYRPTLWRFRRGSR